MKTNKTNSDQRPLVYYSKLGKPEEWPEVDVFHTSVSRWERLLLFFVQGHWWWDEETKTGLYFKEMFGKKYCLKQNILKPN